MLLKVLGMPFLVAALQLVGTVLFQTFIYAWYDQPQFSDLNLSQVDIDRVAAMPGWIHGPAWVVVRAWHLWAILGNEGTWVLLCVLVGGTVVGWAVLLWPAPIGNASLERQVQAMDAGGQPGQRT